jgi:ribose-phosphate pyrophosphokinase
MQREELILFALGSTREFGEAVARSLGIALGRHEERDFEDGEHKSRPLVNVRNRDVFVIESLYADDRQTVNDKLCRLLFFAGALRDACADRVTVVAPYLCYARKDRKTKTRDPVTTRYVAQLFEAVGVDHVVVMDVHNLAAYQNAFRRATTDHLEARTLFVQHFAQLAKEGYLVIASPDVGGIKRAEAFREALVKAANQNLGSAFLEKKRSGGVVSGDAVVGDVEGKIVMFIDDLISSGTTLARAAKACRERGAARVLAAAAHGVFAGDAERILSESALEKIIVTNTIPPFRLSAAFAKKRLIMLDAAPLFGEAIKLIHEGGSIAELQHLED